MGFAATSPLCACRKSWSALLNRSYELGSPTSAGGLLRPANFALVGAEVGPFVDHAAVGKTADAVLAFGAVADLAFAAALDAEHRGRIGQCPRGQRRDGETN